MECIPLNETFSTWLIQYGSFVLFIFLVLGIIALPIPDETLMVFAGILMNNGKLHIGGTILAAYSGSILGISLSYLLGHTLGHYFTHNYGKWIGLTPERLKNVEEWLQKYGKWTLVFGYFIPGIRHFTGFATGMAYLPFNKFALFAYSGAVLWATTFLSIGYFFGNYCLTVFSRTVFDVEDILILTLGAIFLYILYRYQKKSNSKN